MVQLLRLESTTMGQTSQGVKPVVQAKRPVALFSEMKTLGKYLLPLGTAGNEPPQLFGFSRSKIVTRGDSIRAISHCILRLESHAITREESA